jgi:hypothetical protein
MIGFGMVIVGGVIAVIGGLVLRLPNAPVMVAIGTALIIMDLVLRLRNKNNQGWLTKKEFGGYLYFASVWIFGIIVIITNIINAFVNAKP